MDLQFSVNIYFSVLALWPFHTTLEHTGYILASGCIHSAVINGIENDSVICTGEREKKIVTPPFTLTEITFK